MGTKILQFSLFACVLFVIVTALNPRESNSYNEINKADSTENLVRHVCESVITKTLKAPATAKFASQEESRLDNLGNEEYAFITWVDAQNSFSALIRSHFYCQLARDPSSEGGWRLQQLKVDGDSVYDERG